LGRSAIRMIAIALLSLICACGSPVQRATEAGARAQQLYDSGRYREASVELQYGVKQRDDLIGLWLLLGRTRLAMRDYSGAYSAYSRVAELDRANREALSALAELSLSSSNLDAADDYAGQLLALDPRDLHAMLVKGFSTLARQKNVDAMKIADSVLALDAGNEGGLVLKARVLLAQNHPTEAAELMEPLIKTSPGSLDVLGTLREIYHKTSDGAGLERVTERLARQAPADIARQIDYARELYQNGKLASAAAVLDKLLRLHPNDAHVQGKIVDMWLEIGVSSNSLHNFVRNAGQSSTGLRTALARFAGESNDPVLAIELLKPLVQSDDINADTAEPMALFALAENELGQTDRALERANRVLAFDKTNPRALVLRSRIALRRRQFDQALSDVQLVIRDNPDMPSARLLLASIYSARGEDVLARAALVDAAEALPENAEIMRARANFLIAHKEVDGALSVATSFTRTNPYSISGWRARGDLCVAQHATRCADEVKTALSYLRGGTSAANSATPRARAGESKAGT
jgi:tetratricopeptide (TPR) repeat protein